MNMFNCFQAVGFYTALPFLLQYLFTNGHNGWGYIVAFIQFVGFVLLSIAVHESK